jgi:Ca-activated chloride channel family protein
VAVAAQTPVFRGGGDAVRVFVTVTDGDGRLVTALEQKDFEVRDEGQPQPITLFDNTPQPIRLIVMLDVSGSMEGNLPLLRNASEQLFARLRPDDLVRVGTFGRDVEISPVFTRDVNLLRAALPKMIAPDAPTPLWRGLDDALTAFGTEGDARPVILVLSDGKDSGMFDFTMKGRPVSQAEIIDRARSESVMIYAVGMRSRGGQRMPPGPGRGGLGAMLTADLPDPGLARVAQESGGGYLEIRAGQDLAAAFARVADELHSQYLLGFAPPKRDGKRHDLDVRLTQKGLTARARKSYVAPKN